MPWFNFAQAVVKRMKKVGLTRTKRARKSLCFAYWRCHSCPSTTLNWRFRTSVRRSVQTSIKTCISRYDNSAYTGILLLRAASYSVGAHMVLLYMKPTATRTTTMTKRLMQEKKWQRHRQRMINSRTTSARCT